MELRVTRVTNYLARRSGSKLDNICTTWRHHRLNVRANPLGAYTACCSILFLSLYLFDGHRLQHLAGFLVTGFAGILSFSRAGVFALCATATYVIWKSRRISANKRTRKLALVAFACVIISLLFAGSIGGVIRERFTNLYYEGLADDTAIARAIVMQEALLEIPGHLLIGRGTASFNLSFDWSRFMPEWAGDKTWIGNAPLRSPRYGRFWTYCIHRILCCRLVKDSENVEESQRHTCRSLGRDFIVRHLVSIYRRHHTRIHVGPSWSFGGSSKIIGRFKA